MDRFLMLYEENPRFFTNILDSIKDAIFISDEKGQVLWINKTSEEILDISKNEIIGKNVQNLEKDGIFTPSVSLKALEAGKNVSTVQMMRNKRKYITTGHIVKDKNGQHICTVAHC
ncbi:MAG TPA: PAS domain-containing protein, partial [Pseudogracilibacillus sp.]|nr:PAS domain-containing protein [Pseudogracilibacillus sp.]